MARLWIAIGTLLLVLACASAPPGSKSGTGTLWGTLHLVPRDGVKPSTGGTSSYDDPRYRHARPVDYSRPGFAVVFVDSPEAPARQLAMAIRETPLGPRLHPRHGALGSGAQLRLTNETTSDIVVSIPQAELLEKLAAGTSLERVLDAPGPQSISLLDTDVEAIVFVSPGRFAVVDAEGGWTLPNLPPGPRQVFTWHPRFPGTTVDVDVPRDRVERVEIDIGVDIGDATEVGNASEVGESHGDH